jgi:diguanylate cyclase (GGDEF)-like protein
VLNLLVGQFLIYGLAWALSALMLPDERKPVALWCAYCVLQAASLTLVAHQPAGLPGVALPAALCLLLAYACADTGVDAFVHGRPRFMGLWLGLLAATAGFQVAATWGGLPLHLRAAGYNFSVAAMLVAPMIVLRLPLRREFGLWGWMPFAPGLLMCSFAVIRGVVLLLDPSAVLTASGHPMQQQGVVLIALIAAGAFNIAFLGLVVGRLVRRLRRRVDTDAFTALPNRSGLEKSLANAWAASRRHGVHLSVAFIDIDRFKQINDTGGHEAGDRVLKAVAQVLLENARGTDHVGRWGGDEFIVVMPHSNLADAALAMARIRERVRQANIPVPPGCGALSLSIGVATRRSTDQNIHDLVARADISMYETKRGLNAA